MLDQYDESLPMTFPLAGVIGDPISHSKSPRMHKYWLRQCGVSGDYVPLHVRASHLETVLRVLPKMGFVGANVTIPHKEQALKIADHVSARAKLIGAANTLFFDEDGLIIADNTDGYGFITNIYSNVPEWRAADAPALVLGAGGAARAVISALLDAGSPALYLGNRTRDRAEQLAAQFGPKVNVLDWDKITGPISDVGLIVNTTARGMNGQDDLVLPFERAKAGVVVTDLVYTPLQTGFLRDAARCGLATVDGLGMLIHQGVPGFQKWFGKTPKVDDALREVLLR